MFSSTSRTEQDLQASVRKACSGEESAPKRKHVRGCIVYTWDHKASKAFWEAMKLLPIQSDEIQMFKSLIVIHKVLQEGHPSSLVGGYRNIPWIESLGRTFPGDGMKNYGRLIREYVSYIIKKLHFHHDHRGFNGTFEYEEYVSLKVVSDPNEGYEAILDLLGLQDALDDFQRLIFASIHRSKGSECVVSALVPLVAESYGIHKFLVSMLRAMHRSAESDEVLQPLRDRFYDQYRRLYEFYADCSSIRYLTTLITIPKISVNPPNLMIEDSDTNGNGNGNSVELPPRPVPSSTPSTRSVEQEEVPQSMISQPTGMVRDTYAQQQREYELQQQQLQQQQQAQLLQQQQMQQQQQQYWEDQQRQQAEAQQLAQQQLMADQMQRQAQGRVAELERDMLALRGQYDRDQLMLEQYDQKVKALENELGTTVESAQQQLMSKEEQMNYLQEEVSYWKSKYESLAKLYSQLRQEHLGLLAKFKKVQQKASSAQEAVEKREKMEKDLKSKNIELADLIRERDRARLELDRLRGGSKNEIEKMEAEIRTLEDKLATTERAQSSNLSSIFSQHNKEMDELKSQLQRSMTISDPNRISDLEARLNERERELEIMHQTMEETINDLANQQKENDAAMDEQIDEVLSAHLVKLSNLIDAILKSGISRIQDSIFELDSPMQAGNLNSSPEYIATLIEKSSNLSTDFGTSFNNYIADGPNGDQIAVIETITYFTTSISDILLNTKGLTRLAKIDDFQDDLIDTARNLAEISQVFLESLFSENLKSLSDEEKTDTVINGNLDVQEILQTLLQFVESIKAPNQKINLDKSNMEISELVDHEMANATKAVDLASEHLNKLMSKPADPKLSDIDMEINKSILGSALAIITAIKLLISASIDSQEEIVNNGRGANSKASFYKKNNKWTEGLISASKQIAQSTGILIRIADGVLSGTNSSEELIVASNEVAATTAQLVSSARVKSQLMSKTQDNLEIASKKVNLACKQLVTKVGELISKKDDLDEVDYSRLSIHENKTAEMEQQVEILKLENALMGARKRLGEIRKFSYRDDDDDE
ncbi:hypothetical protein CANARDRAFT_204805 [[Candida] arabinofermentans NRRL YB-2248]|uniref:Uncharacterized protein n=1 Tax=[Candida] arabinofermentans NRRL YB-2248 TaxID=983967 RepID=A0A1E4SSY5_9ASCO|nr:hypothetical protein CANARDRAFT_204805 [[Candida] arabinofermentans NRRL YB-2248]